MHEWILFGIALLSFILPSLGLRKGIPFLILIGRWVRWVLFAALFAFFLKAFQLSFRPDWVHFVTGLAVWFLLEIGYYWIEIKALSRSEIKVFH